jgi:hypothetical protein
MREARSRPIGEGAGHLARDQDRVTEHAVDYSLKRIARKAGALYMLLVLTAPPGLLYVPMKLVVAGDAGATADRIRSADWLLRLGIGSELVHQVIVIFLVLVLYRLFEGVDKALARALVVLGALVSVPIMFVNVLNYVAAAVLVGDAGFLSVYERPQLDALAYLFIQLHGQGIVVASVFWGLWLFPFGMLVIRSGFIPKMLGVLLFFAGGGYLASSFATLVMPAIEPVVSRIALPLEIAELPIVFWLLIWGARTRIGATGRAS